MNALQKGGRRGASGFTLIELMIVVAVLAILASIAYPSYTDFIRKTRREAAGSCLLQAAQFMERYYTTKLTYEGSGKTSWDCPDASPHYAIAISDVAARAYKVRATASGTQANDACGSWIEINEKGNKSSAVSACKW